MARIDYNEQLFNERGVGWMLKDELSNLPPWNPAIAERIAAVEGIQLSDEHWEVINYLRRHFAEHGQVRSARELSREMVEQIAGERGSRYLYQLFPGGPVTQGCHIAGIPAPAYHADPSFGSVQ